MRLIDADALIAEMHNVILEDGEDRRTFYEVIQRQPAIELERKTGKMKVRDLLGAIRGNMVIEVEYRSGNWTVCRGQSDSYELDKAFGDREVDNWFTFSGLGGVVCIDMSPLEEEADNETD